MKRKNINVASVTIIMLALSILVMSVGFAIRSQRLEINGNTTIGIDPKWDIHFGDVEVTEGSVTGDNVIKAATVENDGTTVVTYDIKLPQKGDFYEFTVEVVNDGNLDAKIASIVNTSEKDHTGYLKYDYVYSDSNETVAEDDVLLQGETKLIKVRIENIYEENPAALGETTFDNSFALVYEQK